MIPESMRYLIPEEIESTVAEYVDSNNPRGHKEPIYIIRGTDLAPRHIGPQLITTIRGAMGDSCALPMASSLVRKISRNYESRDDGGLFTIAGHSLGGTAVQHISTDQQRRPEYYHSEFESYSFNGLGMPEDIMVSERHQELYSYTMKGDWINGLRKLLGQTEAGIKWEYRPGVVWKPWPTARHSIESVRESLCRCIEGKGKIALEM